MEGGDSVTCPQLTVGLLVTHRLMADKDELARKCAQLAELVRVSGLGMVRVGELNGGELGMPPNSVAGVTPDHLRECNDLLSA